MSAAKRPHFVEANNCFQCHREFTTFHRRHHCRNCGNSFCGQCQTQKISIPALQYFEPERVCDSCYAKLNSNSNSHQKEYISTYLKNPDNIKLLNMLPEPKKIWEFMLMCTEVPRTSTNTQLIRAKLLEVGTALGNGITVQSDQAGNVLFSKPASPGSESKPGICIQGHMDMVGQADDDYKIDFMKDPIRARIDGDYLKAVKTSLGADNGIGLAIGLTLLAESENFRHPLIELLVTYDEEIGLIGANALKEGWVKSKYILNIDSEEEEAICIGCAGGLTCDLKLPVKAEAVDTSKYVQYTIALSGFLGGHSGVDISKGRGNPIRLLARLLKAAHVKGIPLLISEFQGGTAHNAVPRSANAAVWIPNEKVKGFTEILNSTFDSIKFEYKDVEDKTAMKMEIAKASPPSSKAVSSKDVDRILQAILLVPDGPTRMTPDQLDLVQTSCLCPIAKLNINESNEMLCLISMRSFVDSQMNAIFQKIQAIAQLVGGTCSSEAGKYPGWEPNFDSPFMVVLEDKYHKVTNKKPHIYAIHAGLECGCIIAKYPGVDCASIGPRIDNPHSPGEQLLISTVKPVYQVLKAVIEELA